MKQNYLKGLLSLLLLFVGLTVWGQTTVTSTFTDKNWSVGTDEPVWTSSGAATTSFESANNARGVQTTLTNIKSSGLSLTNKTIKDLGNISKVVITCSANGTGGTISSVKVGDTSMACGDGTSYTIANSNGQTPTFTLATPAAGDIVITFASTATSKSVYVKSIAVTYETSSATALSTPTNLITSNITDRSADLSWNAVDNAGSYLVEYKVSEADEWTEVTPAPTTNSCSLSGIKYSTTYSWRVTAVPSDLNTYKKSSAVNGEDFTTLDFIISDGTYNIIPNNEFWGKSSQSGSLTIDKNTVFGPIDSYGMTFEMNSGTSTNSYMKDDQSRAYNGYTLTITAPTGFAFTSINFTGSTWVAPTASVGTMKSKSWSGTANSVTFTFSGTSYMENIELTYAEYTELTVSAAGYATYYNSTKAYTMPANAEGYVWDPTDGFTQIYDEGDVVPAGEPLVIKAAQGTYELVYTTTDDKSLKSGNMNELCGTDEETALTADASSYFYALSLNAAGDANSVGFYWMNETGAAFTNGAHKAYLKLAKTAASKSAYLFNDEATAINAISTEATVNAPAYNLAGQRVNANAKGIVIMNGHKYINK